MNLLDKQILRAFPITILTINLIGKCSKNPVTADAAVMADGKFGRVGKIDAGRFKAQAVQQDRERREQARHQADKAVIMRRLSETVPILMANAIQVKRLEVFEG